MTSTTTIALSAGATTVAVAFALSTFERWLSRRRRHDLAWSLALGFFACGSLALWAGAATGWDPFTFRLFYLFGAVVNVPFLALGTVYLLAGPDRGDHAGAVVALGCAFAAGVILVAPLTGPIDPAHLPRGSEVFGPLPRVLAAVASGVGATVVGVGALWSAVRLLRRRGRPGRSVAAVPAGRLAAGNVVIALGVVVLSASGLLNSVLGEMEAFAATLTLGVVVLFAGFLIASTPGRPAERPAARAPAPAGEAGILRSVPPPGAGRSAAG